MEQRFLDIIWLDNLLVNFIVLWLTRKLAGNSCPMWRLWCSAGLGASYAIALILPGFGCLNMLPFKFLLSLIMLAAGFRIRTLREFLNYLDIFMALHFSWEERLLVYFTCLAEEYRYPGVFFL